MDAGGLDGLGIGRVDVGYDDRTTIKLGLHFHSCNLSLLQTALLLSLCLRMRYEIIYSILVLSNEEFLKPVILSTTLIHPTS